MKLTSLEDTIIALPSLLRPREAAFLLGVCVATIKRRIRAGVLPAFRLNNGRGDFRIKKEDVVALLQREYPNSLL